MATPDFASVLEAMKIKRVAERLRVSPAGLVINRASRERTDLHQKDIESLLELHVLGAVPDDIEIKRAAALGESVVVRSLRAPATKAFKELAATILKSEATA